MKIYWKAVLIIFMVQILVATNDAFDVYHCHTTFGAECWPWFGSFVINIPASLLVSQVAGELDKTPFVVQLAGLMMAYVSVGVLWWSLWAHLFIIIVRKMRGKLHTLTAQ